MGERPQQTINPTAFALQAGKSSVSVKKKAPVVSSQAPMQSSLQPQPMQSQAPTVATPKPIVTPKIGGITPTFGATNINAQPTLWGATPQEVQKQQQIINNQPKVPAILPETGVDKTAPENTDINTAISQLWADIKNWATLQQIKESYPEFSKLDDSVLSELGTDITNWASLDEIIAAYPEIQENKSFDLWQTLKDIGKWVAGTVLGLGASKALGKGAEVLGKTVYWLTLPPNVSEARKVQSYAAWTSKLKPRTAVQTALETPTMMGTRSMFWTQAEKQASKIFTKFINPILEKATTTVNIQGALKELKSKIVDLAGLDPDKLDEYTQAYQELEQSFNKPEYANMGLKDTNTLKKSLQGRTPQKFFKGKEITNGYQELRGQLSSIIKNKLHSALKKDYWVDTAKKYIDWANLDWLKEVWIKAKTNAGLKGGFGGFRSTVLEEIATPVTTVVGKGTYKAGKALQAVPDLLVAWGKKLLNPKVLTKAMKSWNLNAVIVDAVMPNFVGTQMNTPESNKVYIKGANELWIPKEKLKYDNTLKKKVFKTDIWNIDENWNIIL